MSAAESDLPDSVYAWRVLYLLNLEVDEALALNHASDVNPHEVEDLVRKGCDPDLAVRFLLP